MTVAGGSEVIAEFEVDRVTFYELGGFHGETLAGRYQSRQEAFTAAVEHAKSLAGPGRDGFRQPTVSVVTDHDGHPAVQVGDGQVDPTYTLFKIGQA